MTWVLITARMLHKPRHTCKMSVSACLHVHVYPLGVGKFEAPWRNITVKVLIIVSMLTMISTLLYSVYKPNIAQWIPIFIRCLFSHGKQEHMDPYIYGMPIFLQV